MLVLFVSLFAIAFSQPPPGGGSGGSSGGDSGSSSSSTCDMYGGSASYSESVDSGASTRTLTSSGCPNHYSICTGKDFGVCGAAGEEGTDSEASGSDGSKVINIPLYPKLQPNGASTDLEYTLGEIATALNGVSIFGGAVSQTELLEVDNCMSEWSSFDCCGGHAENSGDYHYHFAPPCLMDQAGTMENGHSNQVGWSWDGFPIYGIYSVGGVQVQNCGTEGADATYCQDECGGIEFTDSSVDEYTYRYYFTGEQGDLGTLPMYPRPGGDDAASAFDKFYPYTIKCYRGYRESEDDSAGVDGTTENFVAQPVDGYSDAHPTTCTTTTWECTDGVTTYTNPGTSVQTDETTTTSETTETTEPVEEGPLYSSEGTYSNPSRADAEAKCTAAGMSLCTVGQVFNAVYNEGFADLCYSGWFADEYDGVSVGWFNNEEGSCSGTGFQTWSPSTPGAHCCSSSLADITPTSCASYDCQADGDFISVDDASSTFCPSGTCDTDTCCQSWVAAPEYITLPQTWPKYIYNTAEEADDACTAYHPDLQLCTQDEVQGASVTNSMCVSGWWVTARDGDNANTEYSRGWYLGEDFTDDCGGATGLRSWAPATGEGAAHCCVKSYRKSGYRVIDAYDSNGEYTREGASAYCSSLGYSYELCSQAQLEQVVKMTEPNTCQSGYMSDSAGWYQGDVTVTGCGNANSFMAWVSPVAGAHCCLSSRIVPETGGPYGIIPSSGIYSQSTMTSGAVAAQACVDAGYDQLCTIGQQAYVEDNPSEYGDIACKVGWAQDGSGYDSGYWSGCGVADTWNNAWQPAGNPVAHCCAADVPEVSMVEYPYYNGGWNTYSYDAAAAFCTGNYALCTQDQVELIATEGVTYNDVTQLEDSICKQGWYLDGSMGWYQGAAGACGATGSRSFSASVATYHCCLGFEADLGTTQAPDPVVFVQEPASGYPFDNAQDAEDACKTVNSEYSLCADYEIIQAATSGVAAVEGWQGIEAQTNLCYTAYTDPERSEQLYGWYVSESGSCAGGGPAWKSWRSSGVFAGAYCCYSPAFDEPATEAPTTETPTTEEPVKTEEPTESPTTSPMSEPTTSPSSAPTDSPTEEETPAPTEPQTEAPVADSLPSSVATPSSCADTGFSVEGFESLVWCEYEGTVYLNGRDTCVSSGTDESTMFAALQSVWDNDWDLAAGECTGDKTYDEATDDQLWITNEMCNNLEDDIAELETQTSDYMEQWTQSVVDLVNSQMSNFDAATQAALSDYLATLQQE